MAIGSNTIRFMASESAFSVGRWMINETHAKLLLDMVETLVTIDDWIE